MDEVPTQSPQLDYATIATVGRVKVERSPDRVVLTFEPHTSQFVVALLPLMICTVIGAAWALAIYYNNKGLSAFDESVIMAVPCVIVLISAVVSFIKLVRVRVPRMIEIDPVNLTLRERLASSIGQVSWQRRTIIDVYVDRVRITKQTNKQRWLLVRFFNGVNWGLVRGPRNELLYARDVIREVMHLGNDPLHEVLYPPKKTLKSADRLLLSDGMTLLVSPPFNWQWSLPSLPVCIVLVYWLDRAVNGTAVIHASEKTLSLFRAAVISIIGLIILIGVLNAFRRKVAFVVHQGKFTLEETGVLRPGRAEWPLSEIRKIEPVAITSRRALLRITTSRESIDVLTNRKTKDVDWIFKSLRASFQVAHIFARVASDAAKRASAKPPTDSTPPPA